MSVRLNCKAKLFHFDDTEPTQIVEKYAKSSQNTDINALSLNLSVGVAIKAILNAAG